MTISSQSCSRPMEVKWEIRNGFTSNSQSRPLEKASLCSSWLILTEALFWVWGARSDWVMFGVEIHWRRTSSPTRPAPCAGVGSWNSSFPSPRLFPRSDVWFQDALDPTVDSLTGAACPAVKRDNLSASRNLQSNRSQTESNRPHKQQDQNRMIIWIIGWWEGNNF